MKEQKGNTSGKSESLDDIRLQYECEQAYVRRHFPEPMINTEWNKFLSQLNEKGKTKSRFSRKVVAMRWIGVAVTAAIFAGLIFYVSMETQPDTVSKPLVVLVEKTTENVVKMVETDEKNGEIKEYKLTAKPFEKKGAIVSSKQADYSQADTEPSQLTVSIPRGQTYQIMLSDGTKVWLNAGSRLSFPNRFTDASRVVMLDGEAYFKVARNESCPFVIKTDNMVTHVLGTEFNVKAYKDSESHVTLVKGSVKVEIPENGKEVLLYPGEDIACLHDGTCMVKQVDTERYVQWIEGYFYFDNVCLRDILKELGYWYNLTIEAEDDSSLMDMRLHFVAEHDDGIDSVIDKLNMYSYLSVYREGNTLVCKRLNVE